MPISLYKRGIEKIFSEEIMKCRTVKTVLQDISGIDYFK
jgi:hypothetical protein